MERSLTFLPPAPPPGGFQSDHAYCSNTARGTTAILCAWLVSTFFLSTDGFLGIIRPSGGQKKDSLKRIPEHQIPAQRSSTFSTDAQMRGASKASLIGITCLGGIQGPGQCEEIVTSENSEDHHTVSTSGVLLHEHHWGTIQRDSCGLCLPAEVPWEMEMKENALLLFSAGGEGVHPCPCS